MSYVQYTNQIIVGHGSVKVGSIDLRNGRISEVTTSMEIRPTLVKPVLRFLLLVRTLMRMHGMSNVYDADEFAFCPIQTPYRIIGPDTLRCRNYIFLVSSVPIEIIDYRILYCIHGL